MVEQLSFQIEEGGSIPTSPLQYKVELCGRRAVKAFIETWHYSRSINGVMDTYCFRLLYNGELVGAMLFGNLGMANAWKKYASNPNEVIELRRLCCIDDTPRNTESYFIGYALRWLKSHTNIKCVVSYADPEYGHNGGIYKASNFKFIGHTSAGRVIIWKGKRYHDKAIRTKYNGKLMPYAEALRKALDSGEATYRETSGKYIYIYKLGRE